MDLGAYEFSAGYTFVDAAFVLRIAAGMALATQAPFNCLNVEKSGLSANKVNILDALRLARRALGTGTNP